MLQRRFSHALTRRNAMKKFFLASITASLLMFGAVMANGATRATLAPFPQPDASQVRHVIQLPARADEQRIQVEIQVGKPLTIDCNHYAFGGELVERHVPGWGYDYFVYGKEHPLVSTEKACPPDSERSAFVQAVDANRMLRYNSRMPIVIYTPSDIEVRYLLWHAETEPSQAERL